MYDKNSIEVDACSQKFSVNSTDRSDMESEGNDETNFKQSLENFKNNITDISSDISIKVKFPCRYRVK